MTSEPIKAECYSGDWVKSKARELSGDPTLVEKTIHAFALLGYLVQLEDHFVFKGGTSLLLHVPGMKRLSIDIDIVLGCDINEFIGKIAQIPGNTPFTRFEENERTFRGLPNRRHFKFFYPSSLSGKEESVLLDTVLDDPATIPLTTTKPIKTGLFETETALQVTVPTVEGLIGDKLTAFAPHTIGVPFVNIKGRRMTMQVIKQLYDIGELFDIASSFEDIEKAFNTSFESENEYRDNVFTRDQVLQDTMDTCLALLQIHLKGFKGNEISAFLEDGLRRIDSHLLKDRFRVDGEAKITASKVFYIAGSLLRKSPIDFSNNRFQKYNVEELADINLPEPYERLNRLKPILPEAFYYIWQGIKE